MGSCLGKGMAEFIVDFSDVGVIGVDGFGDMTIRLGSWRRITNARQESIKWVCTIHLMPKGSVGGSVGLRRKR